MACNTEFTLANIITIVLNEVRILTYEITECNDQSFSIVSATFIVINKLNNAVVQSGSATVTGDIINIGLTSAVTGVAGEYKLLITVTFDNTEVRTFQQHIKVIEVMCDD